MRKSKQMQEWKTIIKPKTGLLDLPFREVWEYRGLAYRLVKRNYEVQYKQTILGPFWMWFNLIISSGLFSFVFGYVGNFASDGIPYFLFYMSASVIWDFFSGSVNANTRIFIDNTYLFGKVYFPRLIVPLSNMLFEFVRFCVRLIVYFFVWFFFITNGQIGLPGWQIIFVPLLTFEAGIMGTALGMLVSSLTTKYRDLSHMIGLGLQILMYISPVLYPISQLPGFLQKIVMLNPMSSIIEAFRFALTGSGQIHWNWLLYSTIFMICIMLLSMVLFNQTEKTFIDIV